MLELHKVIAQNKILKEKLDLKVIKGICDESTSRIYGFILYTRRHANVANFLENQNYWDCLDEISGENWPIFSVRPLAQGQYRPSGGGYRSDTINCMLSEWCEPNTNRQILDFFNLNESCDLPCFVGFIWDDNDELQQFEWKIDDSSVDSVYSSLKEIVLLISNVEERVLDEYKSSVNLWREINSELKGANFKHRVTRFGRGSSAAIQFLGSIASILSPFKK